MKCRKARENKSDSARLKCLQKDESRKKVIKEYFFQEKTRNIRGILIKCNFFLVKLKNN